MIDHRQCQYILTIAECHSFSRAAEQLYIAQPSLSRYIGNLERELGFLIFNRERLPLELTPAGEIYVRYIRQFQSLEQEMEENLSSFRQEKKSRLTVGSLTFLASYVIPRIIPSLIESCPRADVKIRELRSNQMNSALLSSDVDIFLTNLPPAHPKLDSSIIASDPVLLVGHRTKSLEEKFNLSKNSLEHPLPISLQDLKYAVFVVLFPWQNMRLIAEHIFKENQFFPSCTVEAPSIISAVSLTSRPGYFTFVCKTAIHYVNSDMPLAYFSVPGADNYASITAVFRKGDKNPMIREFCRCTWAVFPKNCSEKAVPENPRE